MHEETLSSGFPFQLPKLSAEQLPTLAEWNSRYIDYVLNFTKGKKTAAARILGINRRTLYRRNKAKGHPNGEDVLVGNMAPPSAMKAPEASSRHLEH